MTAGRCDDLFGSVRFGSVRFGSVRFGRSIAPFILHVKSYLIKNSENFAGDGANCALPSAFLYTLKGGGALW